MKFTQQNSVKIPADIDDVWCAVSSMWFEREFLPEVKRLPSFSRRSAGSIDNYTMLWQRDNETDLALTRKDLNVKIQYIQIALKPTRQGSKATISVVYDKPFQRHFVKAHCAMKSLFARKMQVLKSDFATAKASDCFAPVDQSFSG